MASQFSDAELKRCYAHCKKTFGKSCFAGETLVRTRSPRPPGGPRAVTTPGAWASDGSDETSSLVPLWMQRFMNLSTLSYGDDEVVDVQALQKRREELRARKEQRGQRSDELTKDERDVDMEHGGGAPRCCIATSSCEEGSCRADHVDPSYHPSCSGEHELSFCMCSFGGICSCEEEGIVKMAMEDLEVGDEVEVNQGRFERVVSWLDRDPYKVETFVRVGYCRSRTQLRAEACQKEIGSGAAPENHPPSSGVRSDDVGGINGTSTDGGFKPQAPASTSSSDNPDEDLLRTGCQEQDSRGSSASGPPALAKNLLEDSRSRSSGKNSKPNRTEKILSDVDFLLLSTGGGGRVLRDPNLPNTAGMKEDVLFLTPDHMIFSCGKFVFADDLSVGDELSDG